MGSYWWGHTGGSYWWGHTGIVGHMGSSSRSYTAGLVIILVGHSTVGQALSMAGCVKHGPYQGCAADQAVGGMVFHQGTLLGKQ